MEHLKVRFLYVLQTYLLGLVIEKKIEAAQAAAIMALATLVTPECLAGVTVGMRAVDFAGEGVKNSVPTWAVFEKDA